MLLSVDFKAHEVDTFELDHVFVYIATIEI